MRSKRSLWAQIHASPFLGMYNPPYGFYPWQEVGSHQKLPHLNCIRTKQCTLRGRLSLFSFPHSNAHHSSAQVKSIALECHRPRLWARSGSAFPERRQGVKILEHWLLTLDHLAVTWGLGTDCSLKAIRTSSFYEKLFSCLTWISCPAHLILSVTFRKGMRTIWVHMKSAVILFCFWQLHLCSPGWPGTDFVVLY